MIMYDSHKFVKHPMCLTKIIVVIYRSGIQSNHCYMQSMQKIDEKKDVGPISFQNAPYLLAIRRV